MGYDPREGSLSPFDFDDIERFFKTTPGGVVFQVGEEVDINGARFMVEQIDKDRMLLKSIKK